MPAAKGAYHKVQKGETLWRISQIYDVKIEDIIAVNRIPNAAVVEEGQLLVIPGALSAPKVSVSKPDINATEFEWPLRGRLIGYFGERKNGVTSKGINIFADEGAKVGASRAGKVVFADYLGGYAYTVILDHADGFFSVYSQNEKLLVKLGDTVAKYDPIAQAGKKGYLYFEIRRNTVPENPLYFLPKS